MKKVCVFVLLLVTFCFSCEAKPRSVKNPPPKQQQIKKQEPVTPPPPPPPAPPKKEPYFTGFNGYPWGTPLEVLEREAKKETRIDTGEGLYKTHWVSVPINSYDRKMIEFFGFDPQSRCNFYFAAYGKNDDKYPVACYVIKDNRLIAGSFMYEWYFNLGPRPKKARDKIVEIYNYVRNEYKSATETITPRHNAFGAILQYDRDLRAFDEVGGIHIMMQDGTGLSKNAPDTMFIAVVSKAYLEMVHKEKPQKTERPSL